MKVSVIVLIYNMEKLLPKCLESLDSQTLDEMEFVLVDDGSTDGSAKICDEWQPKRNKKVVIHKQNGGVMAGWMDGVTKATGEYVGFVDSDDFVDGKTYEILYNKAKECDADISMCDHVYHVGENVSVCGQIIKEGVYEGEKLDEIRFSMMPRLAEKYLSPSLCNKIFKRDLFMQNWQFCDKRVSVSDDVNVVIPCMFGAKTFCYTDKALYHYVIRQGSTSFAFKPTLYSQYELIIDGITRAIEFYSLNVDEIKLWDMVGHFGLQILRMSINAKTDKTTKRALYDKLLGNELFKTYAENLATYRKNKWTKAYADFYKKGKPTKYGNLLLLMKIRNKIFKG